MRASSRCERAQLSQGGGQVGFARVGLCLFLQLNLVAGHLAFRTRSETTRSPTRLNGVVPIAVEGIPGDRELTRLGVSDLDAGGVGAEVK